MRRSHRRQGRAARVAPIRRLERSWRTVLRRARWKAMATGLLPAAMMMGQVVLGGVAAAPHCEQRSSLVPPALSRGAPNGLGFVPDARMVLASGFTLGWRSVLVTVVICGTGDDPLSRLTITLGVHVVGGAGSLGLAARWTGTLR